MQPSLVEGRIHVVDGGYTSTAPGLSAQIKRHYGTTTTNNVVVTHPDKDHAEGPSPFKEGWCCSKPQTNLPLSGPEGAVFRFLSGAQVDPSVNYLNGHNSGFPARPRRRIFFATVRY